MAKCRCTVPAEHQRGYRDERCGRDRGLTRVALADQRRHPVRRRAQRRTGAQTRDRGRTSREPRALPATTRRAERLTRRAPKKTLSSLRGRPSGRRPPGDPTDRAGQTSALWPRAGRQRERSRLKSSPNPPSAASRSMRKAGASCSLVAHATTEIPKSALVQALWMEPDGKRTVDLLLAKQTPFRRALRAGDCSPSVAAEHHLLHEETRGDKAGQTQRSRVALAGSTRRRSDGADIDSRS